MKKIILENATELDVEYVLKKTDWVIEVLTVKSEKNVEKYVNNFRVKNVFVVEDFYRMISVENIDYDEIKKYKNCQSIAENFLDRLAIGNQQKKDIYYNNLSYFLGIFKTKIDMVIFMEVNHGLPHEILLQEMAIQNNVDYYQVERISYNMLSCYHYNKKVFLKLKNNENIESENSKRYLSKIDLHVGLSEKNLFKKIKKIPYMIGGVILEDYFRNIFGVIKWSQKLHFDYTQFDRLIEYVKFKKAMSFMKKNSVNINKEDKYIYFPLHLEPEAIITARFTLESQLTVIRMISNTLPENTFLYIKEHPFQTKLNTRQFDYFLKGISRIKTVYFYKEILKLKNVKIISLNEDNEMLIKKSCGIITGHGTITMEAVEYKKPVILFASDRTIYSNCKDFLFVRSYKDCQNAVMKIFNNYKPEYKNFEEIIKEYMVYASRDGYEIILDTIIKE